MIRSRRKAYSHRCIAIITGERKCAFEGCNALEFRTTGYCLRHKEDLSNEKITYSTAPAVGIPYEKDRDSPLKSALLIPMIALGYVPFVFFWMIIISSGSDLFASYYLFIYSGMCLVILLPIYTVYLVFLTWQRYKNGTLTLFVSIIHILSFIIPLWYFLIFATFSGSPA